MRDIRGKAPVIVCVCVCATVHLWRSEDSLWVSAPTSPLLLRQGFFLRYQLLLTPGLAYPHVFWELSCLHLPFYCRSTVKMYTTASVFKSVPTRVWQALYPLRHHPSVASFLSLDRSHEVEQAGFRLSVSLSWSPWVSENRNAQPCLSTNNFWY